MQCCVWSSATSPSLYARTLDRDICLYKFEPRLHDSCEMRQTVVERQIEHFLVAFFCVDGSWDQNLKFLSCYSGSLRYMNTVTQQSSQRRKIWTGSGGKIRTGIVISGAPESLSTCAKELVPRRNLDFWRRVQRIRKQLVQSWRRGNAHLIISPRKSEGLMDRINA